jgi:glutamate-ammonia-ligase adenylyltransferase
LALGETFLERLRPFVFPRYFDDATLEDIRQTKRQAEAMLAERGQTEREVKLGRGGIRDIEFTVQMLQLLNGGGLERLRTRNTLHAIDQLGRTQCLGAFEATTLASNYVFLRQVEHRVQIEDGRQCHELPESPEMLDELARKLGYTDGPSFMRAYRDRAQETRRILEQFLASKGSGHLWVEDLLNPRSDGDAGIEKLTEMGFQDPKQARDEFLLLATGTELHPFTQHVHQQFTRIAPNLLEALTKTAHPDAVLMQLGRILTRISAPGTLYELLRLHPSLSHLFVTLVENSEYLCSILIRDPGLLELLSDPDTLEAPTQRQNLERQLASLKKAVDTDAALYRLRDSEMLIVAMRELVHSIGVAQVGDELTQLAEVILNDALRQGLEKAARRFGPTDIPFAVLGMGKFGGRELGYGSDLDLIFVYEADREIPSGMSPTEYFAEAAAHTMRILKEPTRYGLLYHIDARLRPDGNKGILAIEHHHLEHYYRNQAQPWERYALMKVRTVAGDPEFGQRIETIARDAAFSLPLDRATLERIETLRGKMTEQASPLDLKKQVGGISEIEYIVRFWQLQHVHAMPQLKRGGVFGALDILVENHLVDPGDAAILREAWTELRRILNRLRMMLGNQTTELPDDPEKRADLARRLNIQSDLVEYVAHYRAQVHAIYQKTYEETLKHTGEMPGLIPG